MISLIWAMDENRVIGYHNQLPWRLPEDLKFFKRVTIGHPIAMGRKTYDSIGKPLPGRENIVITRDDNYDPEGCTVMHSIEEMLAYAAKNQSEEIFVIGGAEIFKEVLQHADKLYLTMIHHQFEGDTFFPVFDIDKWELESREIGLRDEKNPYDYEFLIYKRK
ncbi:dihydrofolate reductase [Mesobacillus selenatarsenatis]|uniref:Dihydrofolate reductase n=1 Tax=Mesobacillus selenatarsenatis (strain DSM 18680 / JCM 14380 / FERM P-15431 / SF-1) TaxID=1321606 RepID=A0A0A8X7M5_MESS1|nr:dihydrofolate reductase [Mesobacillus selenatarsenatis]GAM15289.1 dihydrofolate reductase [Mesobacillus selenatarsenatis SF-1]